VEAKGEDERELISLTARIPFDDRYNRNAALKDLSLPLMEGFLHEVGSGLLDDPQARSLETLARQLNVAEGPDETLMPKNVGLLFFNERPDHFFPATQIDVVWFPEGPGGDRFDEKIFTGPLARITRNSLSHIQTNYLKQTVIKHPDRAEADRFWNFPFAAIEEAVVNAVYHRSYEIREPVEVRITPEDLVVLSFPGPDRSIKMEALKRGKAVSRRYRNRRIGEFLKELDLTEGRSTGISKILNQMEINGSPPPEFETDEDRSFFLIRLPVNPGALSEGVSELSVRSKPQTTPPVTPPVKSLLVLLEKKGQLGAQLIREGLSLKDRTHARKAYINPALELGFIEMSIPDKPKSRLQEYRLTGKGKRIVQQFVNEGTKGHVGTDHK
ncbi:MAG: transcriptional regulator, partial [Deltaproteobacteria bacterium]|nr:transcriptional regulator [Deltaproteobacteria bacterium]